MDGLLFTMPASESLMISIDYLYNCSSCIVGSVVRKMIGCDMVAEILLI